MRLRRSLSGSVALLLASCGGASVTTAPGTPTPTIAAVVKITPEGVVPSLLHMFQRGNLTFVNNDSRTHVVRRDPGDVDPRCGIVAVGIVLPGERRQTEELPPGLNCAYLDGNDPGNGAFRGVIVTH